MKIIERIHNIETGETVDIERDETAPEKKAREATLKEIAATKTEDETKTTARQAIAERLGLTADELAILIK